MHPVGRALNAEQLVPISSYIKVKNLAKVNDLIYVSAEWELGGNDWTLETPQPISLASNAEKSLFISVKAPKADAGGQATLKIRVESAGDSSKYDEQNIIFRVNTAQDSSGPQTEELGEESDFPVDPIWIVSIVLIIGLGSSAAFLLNQKSKGAFGGSGEQAEDYSDEWAGMESAPGAGVPQMVPPAAAPPLKEFITIQPFAVVFESCHSKTISGFLSSNFCINSSIKYISPSYCSSS